MMTAIASMLSSLKAAKDVAESMISARGAAAFDEKRVELHSKILDAQGSALAAQEERSSLVERIGKLEQEIARLRAWDGEKQRYELKRWGYGAFARVLKEAEARGEPIHALCETCYQRGTKSPLQFNGEMMVVKQAWDCPTCEFSLRAGRSVLTDPNDY